MQRIGDLGTQGDAEAVAQSLRGQVGANDAVVTELPARNSLVPGRQSGQKDGNRWSVDITPIAQGATGRWAPLMVVLDLQAPTGLAMKFTTVRLIPVAQP